MKHSRIALALAASALLFAAGAHASATAEAQLTNFTVSIGQLSTARGAPAPSVTFNEVAGDGTVLNSSEYTAGPDSFTWTLQYPDTIFGSGTSVANAAYAGATTSFSGDAYAGTGVGTATAYLAPTPGGYAYAQGSLNLGGSYTTFTLGANTTLDISANVFLSTTADDVGQPGTEFSEANATLYLSGSNGASVSTFDLQSNAGLDAGSLLPDGTLNDVLEVSYAGSRFHTVSGQFSGAANAFIWSDMAAPVPEPGEAALFAGGLLLLGLVSRRRQG